MFVPLFIWYKNKIYKSFISVALIITVEIPCKFNEYGTHGKQWSTSAQKRIYLYIKIFVCIKCKLKVKCIFVHNVIQLIV